MPTPTRPHTAARAPSCRRSARAPARWLLLAAAALVALPAAAAEPAATAAKPAAAKPAGKAEAAGIIVLDGKAPPTQPSKPTQGAEAATGIGLGGCAACDKTTPAGQKKPAAAAKDKTATGK